MDNAMKIQLESHLERLGMTHVSINGVLGGMVFIEAVWENKIVEAVFNISESNIVYRTKGFYTDGFGLWEEV